MMKLRVWSEFATPQQLLEPQVLSSLSRYDVTLMLAFGPRALTSDYARLIDTCATEGVELGLWLLLSDEDGYWVSEANAANYLRRLQAVFAWLQRHRLFVPWIGVDLEPPLYLLHQFKDVPLWRKPLALLKIAALHRDYKRYRQAVSTLQQVQQCIQQQGAQSYTAISEILVPDLLSGRDTLQDLLETPVFPIPWDRVSPMIYNSMAVGYSRGLLSWRDMRWELFSSCHELFKRLGPRASVSIGLTATGKLGDEPFYPHPSAMRPDVAALKAAGIKDVALFNLEGILASPRPEAWWDMVLETPPEIPPPSTKVKLLHHFLRLLSASL
jgi:hypothetical protein